MKSNNNIVTKHYLKKQIGEVNERVDMVNDKVNKVTLELSDFQKSTDKTLEDHGVLLNEILDKVNLIIKV